MTDKSIELIVNKLSEMGANALPLATNQAITNGYMGVAFSVFFLLLAVCFVFLFRHCLKEGNGDLGEFSILGGGVCLLLFMFTLSQSISVLNNPQWYGIKDLIDLVKN